MFLRLKKGCLKSLTENAFQKAGNIHKLAKQVCISKSSLSLYHLERRPISEKNLGKLEDFLGIKIENRDIMERIPDNWRQIKGGKKCVSVKIERGTLAAQLGRARLISARKGSPAWHRKMKQYAPEKYYKLQYEKFKKIGRYKFTTDNGEKVRNELELETANKLKVMGWKYQYEPYILIGEKCFFPDFLLEDGAIIECTSWRGHDKAIKLKEKIRYLSTKYKVFVLIPKALNNYYQTLNKHVIFDLREMSL